MLYSENKLKEIVFPLGGIGSGSIGIAGNGAFVDWEIFNRPNKGSINNYSCFAIKATYPNGKKINKILQGDWSKDLMGKYSKTIFNGYGYGPNGATMCAFPHFKKVVFDGQFPIATLTFSDDDFPAEIVLQAFNPFIPLDSDNSSIPAAFFDISIKSIEDNITYTLLFSVCNPFENSINEKVEDNKYTAIKLKNANVSENDKTYGDITIAIDCEHGIYQEYWYRGRWQDKVTTFWSDFQNDTLTNRSYNTPANEDVATVGTNVTINKNETKNYHFIISWNIPNNYNYWQPYQDENGNDFLWKNYYSTLFPSSLESCLYSLENWSELYKLTKLFTDELHSSTLDPVIIDAISSTISVLKSPTVLRLEDGTFYGWEGLHENSGSCEGTCTHVWSYAYALCFLFPELERSIRNTELNYDTNSVGKMQFRTKIPLGRPQEDWHACVDGQMATIIKIYRDWKITGNSEWLKDNWSKIQSILEYAWNENNNDEWDKNCDGVLEGRQHHTLDMELFGPSSWLQGMYLAALKAASEIANYLGDKKKEELYSKIFRQGYTWTNNNLFNGSYFYHKVDLNEQRYIHHYNCPDYWNEEKNELKYQIGEGSSIDQLLGQWHANIVGLGDIFDKDKRKTALKNMFKNNFKPSLRELVNPWRVFALNDEGGSIICDYPKNATKPTIPIPYCEECMTGFEYAFAGLLYSENFYKEGLKVVNAIRDRYDGEKRNPWNEIECGSNYARPMASFALIPIISGFEFDLPKGHIGFKPIFEGDFKCVWSLGSGWGNYIQQENQIVINIHQGNLTLSSLNIPNSKTVLNLSLDGVNVPFVQTQNNLAFEASTINNEIKIKL